MLLAQAVFYFLVNHVTQGILQCYMERLLILIFCAHNSICTKMLFDDNNVP